MDPELAQWQQQFDATLRVAQTPRRPNESPAQFQQRQAQASAALRSLQMSKPMGQATRPGTQPALSQPQPQQPQQAQGGGIGGIFNYITDALRRANNK